MRSNLKILSILLLVQIGLWLFLKFTSEGRPEDQPVLVDSAIAGATSVQLNITDGEGNAATISRSGEDWQLASGLPADGQKANALIDKITALRLGWPVATNAESHNRFEVTSDKFQRRLSLSADDSETVLYFGTSPGYEQVHVRDANQDSVFAVKVANYELPAEVDDWLDKSLLFAAAGVTSVTWPEGFTLAKDDSQWVVDGMPVNSVKAESAVSKITQLQVLGVHESAPSTSPSDAKDILVRDDEGEYRLSFWPREANNDHVIISTRFPGEAFRVANYVAQELIAEASDFVESNTIPENTAPENITPENSTPENSTPEEGS